MVLVVRLKVTVLMLDNDNKKMADKIQAENEERQKKEEEMKQRLKDAQEVRSDHHYSHY